VPAFTAADLVRQPAQNWITNGGNVYNQRYSSLRQINRDNVARTQVDHTSLSTSSIA
jgi:glucose dehydrogenase